MTPFPNQGKKDRTVKVNDYANGETWRTAGGGGSLEKISSFKAG